MADSQGRTPLHLALEGMAEEGNANDRYHQQIALYLLKLFAGGIVVADNEGMTPLSLACEKDVDLPLIYELVRVDPLVAIGSFQSLARAESSSAETRKRKRG